MATVERRARPAAMVRGLTLAAGLIAATAIWLSRGVLGIPDGDEGARIGFLPPLSDLARLIAAAWAGIIVFRPRLPTVLPLFGAIVLVAPWLPGVPARPLVAWADGLMPLVWLGIAIGALAAGRPWLGEWVGGRHVADPRRAPWIAGGLTLLLALGAARHVSPMIPGGDEPHYLVIAQSLLRQGHLRIEAVHRDEAYREYFSADLAPHYLRRGQDGAIYSIHAPGLPVLLLPAFAGAGYGGARAFIALIAALGAGLAWRAGFMVTGSAAAAWFGYALVALSAPFALHTFTIYPDIVAAVVVLLALRPLFAAPSCGVLRWVGHGALLAYLPWLHTRYAVLAGILALITAARLVGAPGAWRRLAAFLAVPVISAASWLAFFWRIYGTVDPRAPYGTVPPTGLARVPAGITGLLVDQQFGLIANAPALVVSAVGVVVLWRRRREVPPGVASWLSPAVLTLALPYAAAVASYPMWWGGWSAPGRFLVPLMLPLAVAGAAAWRWPPSVATRPLALALLVISGFITTVLIVVDHGALLYDVRGSRALWLEWLSSSADVALAWPSVFRDGAGGAAVHGAVWLLWMLLAAGILAGTLRRWRPGAEGAALATLLVTAGAVTGAMATAPLASTADTPRAEPTSLRLIRRVDTGARPMGLQFRPFRLTSADRLVPRLTVVTETDTGRSGGPLARFPRLPAGRYRLSLESTAPVRDPVAISVGREPGPALAVLNPDGRPVDRTDAEFALPVDVHSIALFATAPPAGSTRVVLQPLTITPRRDRATPAVALRARPYGRRHAYFLDEGAYMERDGFWVKGGRRAAVVIAHASPDVRLLVRNGAAPQHVVVRTTASAMSFDLAPGGVQTVTLPSTGPDPEALFVEVDCAAGFRPADVDPTSLDQRWLGCRVELRD